MKKAQIFVNAVLGFALLLFMVPEVSANWEEMEIVKYRFGIDTTPRHQSRAEPEYNSINNEFMAVWSTAGVLRDDCDPGDMYECTTNFVSIDGRRISPDGELLGNPIELSPPDERIKNRPSLAHNIFTNETVMEK